MLSVFHALNASLRVAMERAYPAAAAAAAARGQALDPQLAPASKPEFGDFQANGALPLAKPLKQAPRAIASAIVAELAADPVFTALCLEPQIAGPGFINLSLRPERLAAELAQRLDDPRLGVPSVREPGAEAPAPVIVDFSSPNIAKEMHVGHLRSTIIGDSLARVLEFRGHPVLRLNHVGDWGTQFGMLITHLKQVAPEALSTADAVDLGDLVAFYRQAKARFDADDAFQASSREEVVKLQGGDPVSLKAWGLLCDQSRREFQKLYDRLAIDLSERGESFYNRYLGAVVADLEACGLLVTDDGARCVFLEGVSGKDGKPLPVIVQKRDGGFNYATTDLAAIRYRFAAPPEGDGARRVIYVTDAGQAAHFAGVFQVAERAGWIPAGARLEHVPFGLVQGDDGKKLKTRAGDTVRLRDLLDEAVERAEADLRRRLSEEEPQRRRGLHRAGGHHRGPGGGEVRRSQPEPQHQLSVQLRSHAGAAGQHGPLPALFRGAHRRHRPQGGIEARRQPAQLSFSEPQEWALARELLKLDAVIAEVEEELLPNRLCSYLFELSQVFNRFYDQVPVLKAEEPARSSRLALCNLTAATLKLGLGLLGIPTLERM